MNKKKIGNKLIWLSKYNYQLLMNIPNQMKLFGLLVQLWEGSIQDEGILRLVKPKINSIRTKNWHCNAHIKLLEEVSLDSIIDTYTEYRTKDNHRNEYRPIKYLRQKRYKRKYH